jgi:3-phytase
MTSHPRLAQAGTFYAMLSLAVATLLAGCAASPSGVDSFDDAAIPVKPTQLALDTSASSHVVASVAETEPMPHAGDSADDPAIWVNSADPALSAIVGTDKEGGIAVYDMSGRQLQYLADGKMNNVDLRTDFRLGDGAITLVTAGDRTHNTIAIYQLDPATRRLEDVAAGPIATLEVYGSCMYHSAITGKYYYIVNSKAGDVEQWELFDNGRGRVDARKVRAFSVGSQTEGCVADDELGRLYIGEEQVAIWRYGAEPDDASPRVRVDSAGDGGRLTSNIEGLTIVYGEAGAGYLIASSQGNSSYAIYRRDGDNAYVSSFTLGAGEGIDAVGETDGIDATAANLGPSFPHGIFVAQDGKNDGDNQNFKLVPLETILQ